MSAKSKGSTQIDWILGILFFITIIIISLYYIAYLSRTSQPYESPLKSQLTDISRTVEQELSWDVYRVPLIVTSPYPFENYPLSIDYEINTETANATYIFDDSGNIQNTEVDTNKSKITWLTHLHEGKNRFYLYYIINSSLRSSENGTSDISIVGKTIANTYVSAEFDNSSITSLTFNGIGFVSGGIMLGASNEPLITNTSVRGVATYPENISISVFINSTRILIHSENPNNFTLHIDSYLTSFYADGSSYLFNGTNTFRGVTGFVDLYNNTGIAMIGTNLNISINDSGTARDIYLYNETDFELYLHDGDYSNAINESAAYPGPETLVGLPERISGIREDKITELEKLYYEELAERIQIDNLGVLIRVENTDAG